MNELFARFPDMKPITRPPSLTTVSGFGGMLRGDRDHDAETGTYVKTLWFTFFFLPIFPMGAYRVANAPHGGWYFIGKVPLTPAAKLWPAFLSVFLLGSAGFLAWTLYTRSEDYQAKKKIEEGDKLRQQGKFGEASAHYREVIEGKTKHAPAAMQQLVALLDEPELGDNGAGEWLRIDEELHRELNAQAEAAAPPRKLDTIAIRTPRHSLMTPSSPSRRPFPLPRG
jgi:hypothetical protein